MLVPPDPEPMDILIARSKETQEAGPETREPLSTTLVSSLGIVDGVKVAELERNRGAERNRSGPTTPSPEPPGLSSVLERNIRSLNERRREEAKRATAQERLAEGITRFSGSMTFVYLHLAFFGFWILANLGWVPGIPIWDESFVVLAMWASVEAIFLSTFVLISQNRMAAAADRRADLDLQISLLAEHEVTKLATLVSAIADRIGVQTKVDAELQEIQQDVAPEAVLDEIETTTPE